MLFPIKEVPATVTPIDVAIITKYTGKDLLNAERASGEILPAKKYQQHYKVFETKYQQ